MFWIILEIQKNYYDVIELLQHLNLFQIQLFFFLKNENINWNKNNFVFSMKYHLKFVFSQI